MDQVSFISVLSTATIYRGLSVKEYAKAKGISNHYEIATTRVEFEDKLQNIFEATNRIEGLTALYIDGHGDHNGITVDNQLIVSWQDLGILLASMERPGQKLFIYLAVCHGMSFFNACSGATYPFSWLGASPQEEEDAVLFACFCSVMENLKRMDLKEAIENAKLDIPKTVKTFESDSRYDFSGVDCRIAIVSRP